MHPGKTSIIGDDIYNLLKSLPSRTYRDSAEVAIALGELKSRKGFRTSKQVEKSEQTSRKGGKAAVTKSVSAAAIAKVLSGIDFPKTKGSLIQFAKKNVSKTEVQSSTDILDVIHQLPEREYNNMADVEKSIRDIL
jgi:mannose-6-phosphate isomerase class I